MGADIYLESIWVPFAEKRSQTPTPAQPVDDPWAAIEAYFDEARASGGYFRNGYNASDVMWAMGLSWQAVGKMLDKRGRLPVERARQLVQMIEARPLTRQQTAAHIFENMTDGVERHPLTGPIRGFLNSTLAEAESVMEPQPETPDVDGLFGLLSVRRDQLLTILRKSIELNEPLYCEV